MPLWTGLIVPAGIQRYNNEPAESHINIARRALDEHAMAVGYHKVRPTRFIKMMREITLADSIRYLAQLGR